MGMQLPSAKSRKRAAPMAEINVTPFVDVMLVLLIIFMVTAPLLTAGVPVNLPDSRAKPLDQEQQPIQMSIDDSGAIFIGEQRILEAALEGELARIASEGGETPPQIFLNADRTLDYGVVMGVMGELNRAGLNRVALVTDPQAE